MREILLATAIAGVAVLAQFVARMLVSPTWLVFGLLCIGGGLAISIPAAVVYHVRLYAALLKRGAVDPRWIWHPTRLHVHLQNDERPAVMIWFAIGVVGWLAALAGCVVTAVAIWTTAT